MIPQWNGVMAYSVRVVQERDIGALNALHRSVGWPERSDAGWRWLTANPARLEAGAAAGWILESDEGTPAGFTGNFVQRFWRDNAVLYGTSGFSIIVAPHARGHSRMLLRTFAEQSGMFARYTFNANPKSSPLFPRYRLTPWPLETHAMKLAWRIDPLACAYGRLWREVDRRAPRLVDPSRERMLNARLGSSDSLILPPGVSSLSDFGDRSRFDDFWTALKGEGRIVADRSPATLRWRLADPDRTLDPVILAFNRGKTIVGYAMAVMAKVNVIEPPVLEVLDVVALRDEPRAIPALMQALLANARRLGAAKVRIQVVSEDLLRRLGPLAASARREGGWGHCHVRFEPGAEGTATWAPTPFDGDYGVCLRPIPMGQETRVAA
jgi:hypothetical protein